MESVTHDSASGDSKHPFSRKYRVLARIIALVVVAIAQTVHSVLRVIFGFLSVLA